LARRYRTRSSAFEANDIDIGLVGQVDDWVFEGHRRVQSGHRLRIRNATAKLTPSLRPTTGVELEEAKGLVADDGRGHARDGVAKKAKFCGQRFRRVRRNNAYPIRA
jgi:hypothetical protein